MKYPLDVWFLSVVAVCLPLLRYTGGDEVEDQFLAVDCQDHKANGENEDGEYLIYPYPADEEPSNSNRGRVKAYCTGMRPQNNNVWTVIQRHQEASNPHAFNHTWDIYKRGFGQRRGDFWIGNEALHRLTQGRKYALRVEIDTWDTRLHREAHYEYFHVGSETDKYKLHVGNYTGNAGDALSYHSGAKFSTVDQDNDAYFKKCTKILGGGWWFKNCAHCNLNGQAYQGKWRRPDSEYWGGVWWLPMHPTDNNYEYYMKYSVKGLMRIRRDEDYIPPGIIA